MNYLAKMTVVELKSVADRMAVPYASRIKKADLIDLIKDGIEFAHLRAIEDAEWMAEADALRDQEETARDAEHPDNFVPTYTVRDTDGTVLAVLTGDSARVMEFHDRAVKRYNPGMVRDRDGKVILTPKQRRRIQQKDRSFARKIGFYAGVAA